MDAHHPCFAPSQFSHDFLEFQFPAGGFGDRSRFYGRRAVDASLGALRYRVRLALHFVHRRRSERSVFSDIWLLPVRDLLLCCVWVRSFFTSRVTWRGIEFDVDADGFMRRLT